MIKVANSLTAIHYFYSPILISSRHDFQITIINADVIARGL